MYPQNVTSGGILYTKVQTKTFCSLLAALFCTHFQNGGATLPVTGTIGIGMGQLPFPLNCMPSCPNKII